MMHQKLNTRTNGRRFVEITRSVQKAVEQFGVQEGLCNVFIHHTSASLVITENADPDVLADLERFMFRLVPDADPLYSHTAEGPDDMPAHVRSVLTQTHLSIPVVAGRCDLGTWQGIFIWEHRHRPHTRTVTVSVTG